MLYRLRNELFVLFLFSVISSACSAMKWGVGAVAAGFFFGCAIAAADLFLVAGNVGNICRWGREYRRGLRIFYCFGIRLSLAVILLFFGAVMRMHMAGMGIGIVVMVLAVLSRMFFAVRGRLIIKG